MKEKWKKIDGYDGGYEISNLGRVKSMWRFRSLHGKIVKVSKEHMMTLSDNGNGYLIVSLKNNNARKNYYVHRLVATYFLKEIDGKNVVNHIDYNKKNNNVLNLEWCTQLENTRHSIKNMKKKGTRTENIPYIRDRGSRFEICIKQKYYGRFKTLEEAIVEKRKILKELNYY